MKLKRIHYLQHVPFEGLGYIETWAKDNNHKLSATKLFEKEEFPAPSEFDWLIIMGGPMSIYDESQNPWLKAEKEFIKSAIQAGKIVIGICLGSQLLAEVLGARVYPNRKKEIGWFPVSLTEHGSNHELFNGFPASINVFHWHGDTFDIPPSAIHLFQTGICTNQAFIYDGRVLGLQFHLEVTPRSLKEMVTNCRHELVTDDFIQGEEEIIKQSGMLCKETNIYLTRVLNNLADR